MKNILKIELWLKHNKFKKNQLAKMLGVSDSYIYKLLDGKRPFTEKIYNLFKKIGIDLTPDKCEFDIGDSIIYRNHIGVITEIEEIIDEDGYDDYGEPIMRPVTLYTISISVTESEIRKIGD